MPLSDKEIENLIEKARAYEKLGNYEEALKVYDKIIEQKPDCAEAWKNKGDMLSVLNRDKEAHNAYEKAAEYYMKERYDYGLTSKCYFAIIAKFIFRIEAKEEYSKDLKKLAWELNNGSISIELRGFFKENGHPLSEKAKVKTIKRRGDGGGSGEWRIKDEEKYYILHGFYDHITIYLENTPIHPHYYVMHAFLSDLDRAIEDIDRAIELEPDRGNYYKYRGNFLLTRIWEDGGDKISDYDKKSTIGKVIADYKTAIERNPADPEIWLMLIELNILLHKWDDAISIYGSCSPFINSKEDQLIRAWLGCLALALAGDPIEDDDKRPLYDQTIRLKSSCLLKVEKITSVINEIQEKEGYKEKWSNSIEIHKLLINHLDDWEDRGDMLKRLGCYKEAVEAYDRAIELKPTSSDSILEKIGDILNKFLGHSEEAIQAYDAAIELVEDSSLKFSLCEKKARLLNKLGRYEEALNAVNKLEELDSHFYYFSKLWEIKGALLEKLGRYEEAIKFYDREIEEGNILIILKALDLKYNLLKKINRNEEADEVLNRVRKVRSEKAEKFYKLACESAEKFNKSDEFDRESCKEDVIQYLSYAIGLDSRYKEDAKRDRAFKNLWDDVDFKRIVG